MEIKPYKIINGNSLEVLDTLEENSIDAIITDPPYELNFMGKGWDRTGIAYNVELWKKALKVLKHGGYLLAFGGTRTYHRIACAIEDAGFEIKDCIMWLYGSGFPKSMNIGLAIDRKNGVNNKTGNIVKGVGSNNTNSMNSGTSQTQEFKEYYEERKATNEWGGWGTQLKPAYEPIIVARKPVEKTIVDNVLKYGVGGINIDECRVPLESDYKAPKRSKESQDNNNARKGMTQCDLGGKGENAGANELGRFPANVIHDGSEEVISGMPYSKSGENGIRQSDGFNQNAYGKGMGIKAGQNNGEYGDEGSASRYFYCAKTSKKDRDGGLKLFEEISTGQLQGGRKENSAGSMMLNKDGTTRVNPYAGAGGVKRNMHPTVKPCELMQYLVRLVSPKGSTILDIFNGSGSTGKAVMFENRERDANYKYIGIELEEEYCKISEARIDYALNKYEYDMIQDIKEEEEKTGQMSLFDFEEDYE